MDNLEITLHYNVSGKTLTFKRGDASVDVDTHEITKGQFNDLVTEVKTRMAPGRKDKRWAPYQGGAR